MIAAAVLKLVDLPATGRRAVTRRPLGEPQVQASAEPGQAMLLAGRGDLLHVRGDRRANRLVRGYGASTPASEHDGQSASVTPQPASVE